MPLAGVLRADFALTRGEPKWFSSSDLVRRGFCAECGTPLFYDSPEADFINITLGSLDDPQSVKPVAQSNMGSRMRWFHDLDALPVEPEPESSEREDAIASGNHQHPDHDTIQWPHGAAR